MNMGTAYTNATIPPAVAGQSSLHGMLKPVAPDQMNGSSTAEISPNLDMQRQVEEFNRTITIILWYKPGMEPIRLQHMIPTFPYFQLLRLVSLVNDLGLTAGSYLDTYDPRSGKWEQHTISTVRVVEGQQRLLYRIRKSLFEGIAEADCLGLTEEVQTQSIPRTSPTLSPKPVGTVGKGSLKRPAPESSTPAVKMHIPNNYYVTSPVGLPSPSSTIGVSSATAPSPPQSFDTTTGPDFSTHSPANALPSKNDVCLHQQPVFYATPPSDLPQYLANPQSSMTTIPYHPHPPLKRWPNDYTVSELTAGFHAMDTLIAQSPTGASLTQRAAFERVFGSRYVKSTVCRHRGVWRKAQGPLREQFEAMGSDERACWGEFVRRFEGRPSAKNLQRLSSRDTAQGNAEVQVGKGRAMLSMPSVVPFYSGGGIGSGNGVEADAQAQVINQREEEKSADEGPIMDSLQKP